jgi:Holliday junction DNA helicase RuvA
MLYSIQGKITLRGENFIVLETATGIGFKVFLSPKNLNILPENKPELKVFTFLRFREPSIELYGFLTPEELQLFEVLNDISGIGPKTALALTSFGTLEELKKALEKGDGQIKGVGRKKMQKIILELTGKIKEIGSKEASPQKDEALDGLIALGFPAQRAKTALSQIPKEIQDTESKVKSALKILGR